MTKEQIQTFTYRISNANKTEMITILYDMGVVYLDDAITACVRQDTAQFRIEINRAKDVLHELVASVNSQTELGRTFLTLYVFYGELLTKAYLDCDRFAAEHVKDMFMRLSSSYSEASKFDNTGAVMGNTQKVYSGITYNKNQTCDNYAETFSNRGYLA